MSNQAPIIFNWQAANPFLTLLPLKYQTGSLPSGTVNGVMTGTNAIYSQAQEVSRYDNIGVEINYTGTPTGTIEVHGSNSGVNEYALTFSPVLTQPAGAAGGYLININNFPYKYMMIKYTNTSGTGVLTAYIQIKSLS